MHVQHGCFRAGLLGEPPGGLRERWVRDAVVGVAAEGNGDGIAGAPVDLLHPMQVLRPGGEEGYPTWERGEQSMTLRSYT